MLLSRILNKMQHELRMRFEYFDSEEKLIKDAQEYWNEESLVKDASHWRGGLGVFKNEMNWLKLGKEHLNLVQAYATQSDLIFPVEKIVEWGCGGGANAVHFSPLTKQYIGIDINSENLLECGRQMVAMGLDNFQPILIEVQNPEAALIAETMTADIFICTYVYELLPSPNYGLRILKLANQMLKENGTGLIQIRYNDPSRKHASRKWGYKINPYHMTTYSLEEFWNYSIAFGFEPLGIYLLPKQELVNDERYAYYILKKSTPM